MTGTSTTPEAAVPTNLLEELEPVVAENLDRHLAMAQEWHPHDYIPWSEGRDFAFLGGEDWSPEQSRLSETAKAAMFTNLLTEDNLPSYHREIATRFGRDGAWGTWVGRWTAEENRHGIAMRDYLVVTRGVDPVELERARMDYMTSGYDSGDKTALEAVTYVSFQELATRVSHRNTGKVTDDPIADRMLARISKDENLHMVFYRNIVAAALEIAPDATMRAIADEVIGFEMPGATMAGFRRNSMIIAKAGIYDLRLHHDDVIMPVLRHWDVFDRTDLGPDGEQAREELAAFLEGLDAQAHEVRRPPRGEAGPARGPVRHRREPRHRLLTRQSRHVRPPPWGRPDVVRSAAWDQAATRAVLSLRTSRRSGVSVFSPRRTRGSMWVRPSRSAIILTASVSYSAARRSASARSLLSTAMLMPVTKDACRSFRSWTRLRSFIFSPHDWMSSHQSQRGM